MQPLWVCVCWGEGGEYGTKKKQRKETNETAWFDFIKAKKNTEHVNIVKAVEGLSCGTFVDKKNKHGKGQKNWEEWLCREPGGKWGHWWRWGSKWKTKVLSSRPRSLPSTAVYMAGLFSLTGCKSHETGGHQGPGPPRQHAPPQSAAHSVPLSLTLSTLTISFTISNIWSLRLSVFPSRTFFFFFFCKVVSQFYQIFYP